MAILQLVQRIDTAANWTSNDPTLDAGEIGYESDTGYWKWGDGATAWTSLTYGQSFGGDVTTVGSLTVGAEVALTPMAAPTHSEGLVFYDSTNKALSYYNEEADVTVNTGQETMMRVRNSTGSTITNGSAVYINGSQGANLPTVALARADALATARCIGLATHDIENNTNGYITTLGEVRSLDTSAFSAGNVLFLDTSTAGTLTATRPTTGFAVVVGVCTISNVSVGEIKVIRNTVQRADVVAASQNETVSGAWTFSADTTIGNYVFNSAGAAGAGQDNYVLTYDNGTGKISLEASAGGGGGTAGHLADSFFLMGG